MRAMEDAIPSLALRASMRNAPSGSRPFSSYKASSANRRASPTFSKIPRLPDIFLARSWPQNAIELSGRARGTPIQDPKEQQSMTALFNRWNAQFTSPKRVQADAQVSANIGLTFIAQAIKSIQGTLASLVATIRCNIRSCSRRALQEVVR